METIRDISPEIKLVEDAIKYGVACHEQVNHQYDNKPYSTHLQMVYDYGWRFKDLLDPESISLALASCWVHDVIEDTRQTYNDVKEFLGEEMAEIAYALTNEKGKNRSERANDKYYKGIRQSKIATFVKLCDRLANIQYSGTWGSSMLNKYRKENEHFKSMLYREDLNPMFDEIDQLLKIGETLNPVKNGYKHKHLIQNAMTKLFFDTEFTGLHQKTTLISLGIVAESGETFYAEFTDYNQTQVDDWIRDNVLSKLKWNVTHNDQMSFNSDLKCYEGYGNTEQVKYHLQRWLSQFESVQMWSDCLSYDWVLFCQIFGHAFNIPKNVYYIPFDICPLLLQKTGNADISREEYATNTYWNNPDGSKSPAFFDKENNKLEPQKHNALWDANIIRACYEKLTS